MTNERRSRRIVPLLIGLGLIASGGTDDRAAAAAGVTEQADGYRGIWFTLGQFSKHGDKYSGGLGTYTANHNPIAVYSPAADKTFFTYGGTRKGQRHLLIMASYYDHKTGQVPRPTIVHDKQGVNDPHDNGSLNLDDRGYVWIFISGRAKLRPGFKYRSKEPFSVDAFERVSEEEMTYPQPWFVPGRGWLHLFTKYTRGRELYWETSPDGVTWSNDQKLAGMGGHYQVSAAHDGTIASFFNYHPGGNVDRRTNLYYVQTDDFARTWTKADGTPLELPLTTVKNPALVVDYAAQGKLMYTCDLNFDRAGRPLLLHVTSRGAEPGPENDPREFCLTRWDGHAWQTGAIAKTDHNYDMGSLWVTGDGDAWKLIAPTLPGPRPYGGGGEMCLWSSSDQGKTWTLTRQITSASPLNHNYARRPLDAHDPFFAFWADGDPAQFSESRLYFCDSSGEHVRQLPYDMEGEFAIPMEDAAMNRRTFLTELTAALTAVGAAPERSAAAGRPPRILLRSSWQTVNIGDIGHTPGVIRLLGEYLPEAEVTLWPSSVGDGVEEMLRRNFPKLKFALKPEEVTQAFAESDFLLHGSGASLVAQKDVARWREETGKPYGIYGITFSSVDAQARELINGARFAFFRDSVSLEFARDHGLTCPVMEFGPDGAFAVNLRNDTAATAFLQAHALEDGKFLCVIPRLRYTPYWLIRHKSMTAEDQRKHARNEAMKEHDHAPLREAISAVVRQTALKVLVCPEDESQVAIGKAMLVDPLPDDVKAKVVWRDRYWLTDEALSTYVRSAGLFGLEMHSPIMCVGNGIPAIVCRFQEQTSKGIMWRDIGLGDWLFDMDAETDVARIVPTVLALANDPAGAKTKVAQAQEFVRRRQRETMAVLKAIAS